MLVDTYERIAQARNWRIDVAGHSSCHLTSAAQTATTQAQVEDCAAWKQNALAHLRAHPELDGLIVTHLTGNGRVPGADGRPAEDTVVDGLVDAWQAVAEVGIPIVAIHDNPTARTDVVARVGQMQGPTTSACDSSRGDALSLFDGSEQAAARMPGVARIVDLTHYYCTSTTCPAVIGGALVHRDRTHLTNTFAVTLAPYLGDEIADALRALRRRRRPASACRVP